MLELNLNKAVKQISNFLEKIGLDGSIIYSGNETVTFRSRHLKDEEIYDRTKLILYIKGKPIHVEHIGGNSEYPSVVINLIDLLRCMFPLKVTRRVFYNIEEVEGFDVIDEEYLIRVLKSNRLKIPISTVEISDKHLELEISDIGNYTDDDINKCIKKITTSSCIIDRTNSVISLRLSTVIEKLIPEVNMQFIDGRPFITKMTNNMNEGE